MSGPTPASGEGENGRGADKSRERLRLVNRSAAAAARGPVRRVLTIQRAEMSVRLRYGRQGPKMSKMFTRVPPYKPAVRVYGVCTMRVRVAAGNANTEGSARGDEGVRQAGGGGHRCRGGNSGVGAVRY